MYDGLARKSGKYRSLLEQQWANFFRLMELDATYVDQHWHDFVVDGHYVEIKPHGEAFLKAAMRRMPRDVTLVIIQGSVYYHSAWTCQRIPNTTAVECNPVRIAQLFKISVP